MSEAENDDFYWEPGPADPLRQGDLLLNVPIGLMPQRPRFVIGDGPEVAVEQFDDYPEHAPSDQIVVDADFGVMGMVVTPTCHVSEGEKDEDIVSVVPVQALRLVVRDAAEARNVLSNKKVPKHMFALPRTELGGGVLRFDAVALLDRPASMRKDNLRDYRRLGLYVESRIALRKALARFWARGDAAESIERSMRPQIERRALEDLE
jgi:hypothetical protein